MLADAVVRLASIEDATTIATMSREAIEHGLGWRWRPPRIREAIGDPERNVAVVGETGHLRGFGIMRYGERHAHLQLFAVHRDWRRRGVGRMLLAWLERVAAAGGAERIVLECRRENDAARCFYSELGYHERAIEPAMYRGQEDGIHLEKWLRAAS